MRGLATWADDLAQRLTAMPLPDPLHRFGISAQGLLFGVRLAASVCLALFVAFWFQLDAPYWAATSASIVAQPQLGASLRKGRFRAIGTVIGGVVIVLLVAAFPQNPMTLLASLILWGCICGVLATVLSNFASYAAALAGYTTAVVFASVVDDPQSVFMVSVWRVTEIGIGILSAVLIHTLTDFGNARERLARSLGEIGQGIAAGLVRTLRAAVDESQLRVTRRELIESVIALGPTADEAIGEPSHVRSYLGTLQSAVESLFVALSAWRGIANHLTSPARRTASVAALTLLPLLTELADLRWSKAPAAAGQRCTTGALRAAETPAASLSVRLVLDGIVGALRALERVAYTIQILEGVNSERAGVEPPRSYFYVPDFLPAALNALRITLALSVADVIWILTAWPHGPRMITFAAVGVILFSARPHDAYPRAVDYAVGTALAGLLAALLNLVVLPGVHGDFLSLAVVLCATFIPLGMFAAGPWYTLIFSALATNLMPILSIQNQRSYDVTETLNVALAMFAGTAVAALTILILPPLSPAQRIQRLRMLTLRDLRALVRGRRRFTREGWVARICGRLEVMPSQATLEEDAQMLAAFSVGEAAICLRELRPSMANPAALDKAFAALDRGDIATARARLASFSAGSSRPSLSECPGRMTAAIQASLIEDALQRHSHFFERVD